MKSNVFSQKVEGVPFTFMELELVRLVLEHANLSDLAAKAERTRAWAWQRRKSVLEKISNLQRPIDESQNPLEKPRKKR